MDFSIHYNVLIYIEKKKIWELWKTNYRTLKALLFYTNE